MAGRVSTYAEKYGVENSGQRVSGVKALAIELDVELLRASKRPDADIARSVENVLQCVTFLPKDHVKVMVENGFVTLSGEVDWEYQRQAATAALRYLMGVTGVSDQIVIKKPKVSSSAVKSDVEATLKRRATVDAHGISVEVHGADVTLTGKVHSWSERSLARNSAWAPPAYRK